MKKKEKKQALEILKSNVQKLTIKDVIQENALTEGVKNEIKEIKEIEKTVGKENLVHRTNECAYSINNFRTINTFARDIDNG